MRFLLSFFAFTLPALLLSIYGQYNEEINPPENIKTIIFKGPTEDQFPIIQLGETLTLEFDDLTANEQDYYYKIVHCDYDWKTSRLLKSQYLSGMDNQRIIDYENSYSTLQPYSNYRLAIPNNEVRLKVTGNYVLEIYNNYNELQFSRRFVVYQDRVVVGGTVKLSRDFNYINDKQVVQMTVNIGGANIVNPKSEIKIALLQNYYWPTAIYNVKPQFTIGNELIYRYDQETSFFGGNEFLNFDTKDLRSLSAAIRRIELIDVYQHYLYTNDFRYDQPYTYFPDINGDFAIRTFQGRDASRESEYSKIHFSLPYTPEIALDEVYVFGKFNNYVLNEENKMSFNEATGNLELAMLMKQGFYNYKYVIKTADGQIDQNRIGGNFHFTENNYLILVYYRDFGNLYDSIIGIGNANSRTITN